MAKNRYLDGKKVLIVDDEPDVLDTLEELLAMCEVSRASSFDEAGKLLDTRYFEIAVLDIMGVEGYELLKIANQKGVSAVMFTAHALSPEDAKKSCKEGAASYVPKEKMSDIALFLEDILESKEKGKNPWWRWFERLGSYFEKKFGDDWSEEDKDFIRRHISY